VTFKLPKGVGTDELAVDYLLTVDGIETAANKAVTVRTKRVWLNAGTDDLTSQASIEAQSGSAYEVGLAALKLNFESSKERWFVGRPRFEGEGLVKDTFSKNPDGFIPLLPGAKQIYFGSADGFPIVEGKEGKAYTRDVDDMTGRRGVRIHPPVRELPDCVKEWASLGGDDLAWPLDDQPMSVGVLEGSPNAGFSTTLDLRYSDLLSSEGSERVVLPMSGVGKPPVDFRIGRIDVDHVAVTTGNKTVTVEGTYRVIQLLPGNRERFLTGIRSNISCSTNTGISVLPGTYKVIVQYQVTEGNKTSEYTVKVP
jgi:hypothetical protein